MHQTSLNERRYQQLRALKVYSNALEYLCCSKRKLHPLVDPANHQITSMTYKLLTWFLNYDLELSFKIAVVQVMLKIMSLAQGWSERLLSTQINAGILVTNWWKPLPIRWQPKKTSNFANFEIARNFERSFAARTWRQPQTLPKCFSDDSRHFVWRYKKHKIVRYFGERSGSF